jgi:uncharacterized membrane protein
MIGYPNLHLRHGTSVRRMPGPSLRITTFQAIMGLVLLTLMVEGLLAARFFIQMAADTSLGVNRALLSATSILVAPFSRFETSQVESERASGFFDFATVLAAEFYLIAAIVIGLLVLIIPVVVRQLVALYRLAAHRGRQRVRRARRAA